MDKSKFMTKYGCGRVDSVPFLRKLITGAELKSKPTPELRELTRSVDRIGNNLNQIAHRANAVGYLKKSEWDSAAASLKNLREEIRTWR